MVTHAQQHKMKILSRSGFLLLELLIAGSLLPVCGGAMLFAMHLTSIHAEYLRQSQVAMNAAQGELEQLRAASFSTLWKAPQFAAARAGRQCAGEDANCDGLLDPGEDANGNGVLDPGPLQALPNGQLAIQIRSADLRNPTDPSLLDVHVVACWRHRGRQIGEAACQDGPDLNSWVDSAVMVSSRIAKRD